MATIEDIARCAEQRAQSCRGSNDFVGEQIAVRCAQRIRQASTPAEAQAIESEFYGGAAEPTPLAAAPGGCLGGLFGGLFGRSTGGSRVASRPSFNSFGYNDGLAYSLFNGLLRTGGSSSWRNHNPGGVPYDEWSISHGAVGSDSGMAVFPNYETGRRALAERFSAAPGNQSIDDLVRNSYLSNIPVAAMAAAGINPATPASQLSPQQLNHLMDTMETTPGAFEPGQVVSPGSSDAPAWAGGLFAADAAWQADTGGTIDSASEAREVTPPTDNS